jgi:hypothetical protein
MSALRGRALAACLVAAAALLAVFLLVVATDHARDHVAVLGPGVRVGVVANTLDSGTRRDEDQRLARATGAGWIREELRWSVLEPQRGRFDWSSFDALLTSATENGLHVLPLLIGPPDWADVGADELPGDVSAAAAFMAAAARRYGPGGSFWRAHPELDATFAPAWFELFNEPFLPRPGAVINPARYAAVARATADAGRAANPNTRYLLAVDTTYADTDGRQRDWLGALVLAQPDILHVVDGAAIHPYGTIDGGTGTDPRWSFERIGAIRRRLAALGAGALPFWITEVGWSTCDGAPEGCVSEAAQADMLAKALDVVAARHDVSAFFVYRLQDLAAAAGREGHFGLLRGDYSHKPAWSVLHRATTGR